MADAIVTIDERGTIQSLNVATTAMFGYPAEELIGRNVNVLAPEPNHSQYDGYIQRYLVTGEAKIIGTSREVEARRQDGSTYSRSS